MTQLNPIIWSREAVRWLSKDKLKRTYSEARSQTDLIRKGVGVMSGASQSHCLEPKRVSFDRDVRLISHLTENDRAKPRNDRAKPDKNRL